MTAPAAIPEVSFVCVPNHVSDLPGYRPVFGEVLRALIWCVETGDDHPTRARLKALSGLSVATVSAALNWCARSGVIAIDPDSSVVARRRYRLLWRRRRGRPGRRDDLGPPADTDQRSGANGVGACVNDIGACADDIGASADTVGAPLPYSPRSIPEGGPDVPSVALESDLGAAAPAAPEIDGTGRDGFAALPGRIPEPPSGGEAGWEGPDPTPGQLAEWGAIKDRRTPDGWTARARLADWAREQARRAAPPPPPRPSTFAPGVAHGPARPAGKKAKGRGRITRDERYTLAEILAMTRRLAHSDRPFGLAGTLAEHLAKRYRDFKRKTVDHFTRAILNLGPGEVEAIIRDAEDEETDDPAFLMAKAFKRALENQEGARRARNDPRQDRPDKHPGGGRNRDCHALNYRTQGVAP